MADTHNEAEVMHDYPVTSGLGADDKHEGRQLNLIPKGNNGQKSVVPRRVRKGFE